jgi:hypothetical protein
MDGLASFSLMGSAANAAPAPVDSAAETMIDHNSLLIFASFSSEADMTSSCSVRTGQEPKQGTFSGRGRFKSCTAQWHEGLSYFLGQLVDHVEMSASKVRWLQKLTNLLTFASKYTDYLLVRTAGL